MGALQIEADWRFGRYQRIEAGYFELARSGRRDVAGETVFGETLFAAGSEISSRSHLKSLRLGYAALIRDAQKELGVFAGVH